MNVRVLFKSLVDSAIDFAERSVEELKKGNYKHSLISFCTALELFLKARLILEHWTLVVSNSSRANPKTFERGDFHSVSMEEAIERLENIVGEKFSVQEKRIFDSIREQRNRMVHFFDPASTTKRKKDLQKVAALEYSGWYYLSSILQTVGKLNSRVSMSELPNSAKDFIKSMLFFKC